MHTNLQLAYEHLLNGKQQKIEWATYSLNIVDQHIQSGHTDLAMHRLEGAGHYHRSVLALRDNLIYNIEVQ